MSNRSTTVFVVVLWSLALIFAASTFAQEEIDISHLGTATQPTEWNNGQFPAALAIDGNRNTFSHTDVSTVDNHLMITFAEEHAISRIEMVTRGDCCGGRLTNAVLRLFDAEGDSVFDDRIVDPGAGFEMEFDIPKGVVADRVRIGFENGQTNPSGNRIVHLGEVRVIKFIDNLPVIESFTASATNIASGGSLTLDWQVTGADAIEISGVGAVADSGPATALPARSTVYTLIATNGFGSRFADVAVTVDGLLLDPVLNEFSASNTNTYEAADGSSPDWIEIRNPNPVAIDLGGFHLTDDATDADKWEFPEETMIAPLGFLVVEAAPTGTLTTGFALNRSAGSYLALTQPDGRVVGEFTYPGQREDVSYGLDGGGEDRYFLTPTPGAPNSLNSVTGFVADTKFNIDRGFYDTAFDLEITTASENAAIYFTTDGSEPAPDNPTATRYTDPISISTTMAVRAVAFEDGLQPSNIDTQTYIFLDEVLTQPSAPAGFPTQWIRSTTSGITGTIPALSDYAMDARIVNSGPFTDMDGIEFDMQDAMKSVPTMSIVMNIDEFLDQNDGIHANAGQRGRAWERKASVEVIDPAAGTDYQAECGVRTHGGWNRHPEMLKKSFRLYFRSEYGDGKFDYPLIENTPDGGYDRMVLRSGNGKAWPSPWRALSGGGNSLPRTLYLRDQFARHLQNEMGQPYCAGTFVHLYINGLYWGLYNPVERTDEHFGSAHFGGKDEDYDVIKWIRGTGHVAAAGNDTAWNQLISLARSGAASAATYEAIGELLDLENFVDYMLVNYYLGNIDWLDSNAYAMRNRGTGGGFRFFCWDAEETLINTGTNSTGAERNDTSSEIHHDLKANREYRLLWADRVQKHFFAGGALDQENSNALLDQLARKIDRAIIGESARWGDLLRPADPYAREDWLSELNNIKNNYLAQRINTTLNQLKADNLYPDIQPPTFLPQRGGQVTSGAQVVLDNPLAQTANLYFTTGGSDPRLPGGAISPSAQLYEGGTENQTIVSAGGTVWKYLDDGSMLDTSNFVSGNAAFDGTSWKHLSFDDDAWASGPSPLGYGGITNTTLQTTLSFGDDDINKHITYYLRHEFDPGNPQDFTRLNVSFIRDDGAIVYLNGHEIARSNLPPATTVTATTLANTGVGGGEESDFVDFTVDPSLLVAGTNVLAVELHQFSANSSDVGFDLELNGDALVGGAQGIVINEDTLIRTRALSSVGEWSAIDEVFYTVGDRAADLVVTEIMYHPGNGFPGDAEYLEITNVGTTSHQLSNLRITGGIEFNFAQARVTALEPGARLLVVRDLVVFQVSYPGVATGLIAGEYSDALGNGGDTFSLVDDGDNVLWTITYDDDAPWPRGTDGDGFSLTFIAPEAGSSAGADDPGCWRASVASGGSPGESDTIEFTGGDLIKYALAGVPELGFTDGEMEFTIPVVAGSDSVVVSVEWSSDLATWNTHGMNLASVQPNEAGTANYRWEFLTRPATSEPLYLRARLTLRDGK